MTKSASIPHYNQDRFSDDDFVANFVARHNHAEALLNGLRYIAKGGPNEHQIVVGARGMGKTSLLRRLAIGITSDPVLKAVFIPLRFREEQYNVISLDGFWRNCGESLAEWCEEQGNQVLADRLDTLIETPEWRDAEKARDAFLLTCTEAGGRAVLLLDNLDLILEGIKPAGCWQLRATLQKDNGPIIIGAATRLLAQGADRDAAFYEFFHPHILEPLTERELLSCLNALASQRGDAGLSVKALLAREPERARALYVLTGGNPRILGLIYSLLEQSDNEEIFADLEALLDQVTPFYKAQIESYQTPLQRAVIDGIALNWDPITSGALSQQTGVEVTTLSAQLIRLKKDGLIEEVEASGTRAAYQLAERFLNIWYLMRHGTRKTKQRLRWFTAFLTKLFSTDELGKMAGDIRSGASKWNAKYCEAIIEAYDLKSQEIYQNEKDSNISVDLIMASSEEFRIQLDNQIGKENIEYEKGFTDLGVNNSSKNQKTSAVKMLNNGIRLSKLKQYDDAIAVFVDVVEHFGVSDVAALQEVVAEALGNKGVALGRLDRSEEEIAAYDEVVARFGASDVAALQEQVAKTLVNKGFTLGRLDRTEEEIAVLDEVVARFGASDVAALQEAVARALVNKGVALIRLGRSEDAVAVYDEVVARFGASDVVALQGEVAKALVIKGVALIRLGRSEDAVAVFDEVLARFGDSDVAALQEQVAKALAIKGVALSRLDRPEEEIVVYDEVVARFGDSDVAALQELVARALVNKGLTLGRLDRTEEEIAVLDEVVARFGASDVVALQEQVAKALANKGVALDSLGRSDDAVAVYDEMVARFGTSDVAALQEAVATAQVYIAKHEFWQMRQTREAITSMYQVLESNPDNVFANANLLWMLVATGEPADAIALMSKLGTIAGGGRALMHAGIDLSGDNLGASFDHLGEALAQGLSGDFDFSEDLLWYLRIANERGFGQRVIDWFVESGNADRYAPVYGAFVALVRGERMLLDLNPEVRSVALPLYAQMSAGKGSDKGLGKAQVRKRKRGR